MNVLVTGGSGLVGSAIREVCDYYPQFKFTFVNSTDCNLLDFDDTVRLFQEVKPNYVIHLAANVGGLFKNMKYNVEMLEDNLLINLNVVKCCRLFGVTKMVGCLSTCVYPAETKYPIVEEYLHQGPPDQSNEGYAYSKRILDVHLKACNKQFNTEYISILPCNIYGPNDNYNLLDAHVIPALIHQAYLAKLENKPLVVKGTGTPLRQFIYSLDLANIIINLLVIGCVNTTINVSTPQDHEVSIKTVAELIAKEFEIEQVIYDDEYNNGQYKKTVCNDNMVNILGQYNIISIQEGIAKSVKWFKENYNRCRK